MRFQDLGLLPELVSNAGYDAATPVQSESIPAILNGRDVLAGAQTGTGKTAAFHIAGHAETLRRKKYPLHREHLFSRLREN